MEMTFIEKLKQIERVKIYDLLSDFSIWKSMDINYLPPHVERLWCQLGNYRLSLHFIHSCEKGKAFFHPHPWPNAVHVIEGEYEMGMGFGEGLEVPEVSSTIISQGNMYYEMTDKNVWHYVRPTGGVCASVMLSGEPWGREMPEESKVGDIDYLHNDRVVSMLQYFKSKYYHTVEKGDIVETLRRKDWVMLDESKMNGDDYTEYGELIGKKGFVIKNNQEDGICLRFDNERFDEFNPDILIKLENKE